MWTRDLPLEQELGDLMTLRRGSLRLEPDQWSLAVAWSALGAGLSTPDAQTAASTEVKHWLTRLLPGVAPEARRTAAEALSADRDAGEGHWQTGTLRGDPGRRVEGGTRAASTADPPRSSRLPS
ncbi:hypothetical protein [Deinococcus hopiensis]|uniref:hypothetical protein n=1 Tax=Deinococcus hopiensis TaxID=309885 RepID=UPI000A00F809|nr:hypothetical protein [Deinococcus hopiensis]